MKLRKIAGVGSIAVLSALLALFVFTRLIERPLVLISQDEEGETQAQFTNTFSPSAGLVDFSDMAENIVHTVVHVKTKTIQDYSYNNPIMEFFYGESSSRQREVKGFGSGVIISTDGYIITNNHVIEGADEVDVTLNDKRSFHAIVVGRDPSTDIALLKVDTKGLPHVRYGNSDKLRLGQWVVAIGNPFNLTSTVTAGIVSAKGRSLGLLNSRYRIESFIQTDAALNMGNSGGALVNIEGELVGITTAIISPNGAYAGNSFAIPINIVKKVIEDLEEYGEVQRAIMGINILEVDSEIAKENDLTRIEGVYLEDVVPDGAADDAGLKKGDIILQVGGKKTNTGAELTEEIGKKRPGDKVKVLVVRNKNQREFDVVLKNLQGGVELIRQGDGAGIIFGVMMEPLSMAERDNYRLNNGLKVTDVQKGRFKDIGIVEGYIITGINGGNVSNLDDVKEVTEDGSILKSIEGIQSNGTVFSYRLRQ